MTEAILTRTTTSGGEAPRWYSLTLWHTMSAAAWWRLLRAHGFRIRASRLPVAVWVTLNAVNNSLLGLVQSALYGARVRDTNIEHDPIFVLGHWRSGTTHLQELLALDDRFAFPTSLECFAPHHCLLTDRIYPKLLSWMLPGKRLMDDMAFGFERPQEDELALVALGAPSPMWLLAYPGEAKGRVYLTLHDISEHERQRWEGLFRGFLRLVTFRHQGKPIVLKSPTHTARMAMLARMFPRARFLHIVRDPYVVFASTINLWRKTQAVSALVDPNASALEAYVLEVMKEMYDGFEAARAALQPGRFHQVRYEDLVRDPLATLEQSYQALGLGDFDHVRPRVANYLAGLRGYRNNEYAISPEGRTAVREAWGAVYRQWGYDI
jgi:hypothetical protein